MKATIPKPQPSGVRRRMLVRLVAVHVMMVGCVNVPSDLSGGGSNPQPASAANLDHTEVMGASIDVTAVSSPPSVAPAPSATGHVPWSHYGAPDVGMYIGWYGKPNAVNEGDFKEIFSGGSNGDGHTANQPWEINATLDWLLGRFQRPFSLFHIYEAASETADFPITVAEVCDKRRQLLMVSLSLGPYSAQELAEGAADSLWQNWASGAKAWGKPVILRWGWEAPVQPWAQDPVAYKRAWQRMWRIIKRDVGASNVKLAYTPVYFASGWGTYQDFFPGDDYVDWVGVDDYQQPDARFEASFKAPYDWFAANAPGKPFMVAEWGMKHTTDDGIKPYDVPAYPDDWYCQSLEAAKAYPNIKAFVLWDNDQEINSALGPAWTGTLNLIRKLQDPYYLRQAPVL